MHRRPHDEHEGMKVWLSASEVEQYLGTVEDTTHRIALALAFRCGPRIEDETFSTRTWKPDLGEFHQKNRS